jgi:hypothetical protein
MQHTAAKNKVRKGFLFFALLLGFFTFSGAANIAQQNNNCVQCELVLPTTRFTKSCVSYPRITCNNHYKQYAVLSQHLQFTIAITIFNRVVVTWQTQQSTSAAPKQQQFLQVHNHIPTATEPPYQA